MRIACISWVRNEADIIEAFLRHHLRFAERMIVIDNGSDDRTPDLIEAVRREGHPVELRHDRTPVHRQPEALTPLLKELEAQGFDWILPLDADEFLRAEGDLHAVLQTLPTDSVTLVPWKSYLAYPPGQKPARLPFDLRYRKAIEQEQYYKVLVPRAIAGGMHTLAMGNHALLSKPWGMPLPARVEMRLWLAHFPVRSAEQFSRKVRSGWQRFNRHPCRQTGHSFHWQAYARECDLGMLTPERLLEISATYAVPNAGLASCPVPVLDPLPFPSTTEISA